MKKRLKRGLIVALFAATSAMVFAGCSTQMSKEEFLSQNGLTTEVTYYANGGFFDDDFEKVEKSIYYKDNSYAYEVTEEGQHKIEYTDYELLGWYYAKLDANNEPIRDEKGNMLIGEAVPFDKPITEWTTTHIVASWGALSKVKVILVLGDEGDPISANETVKIETEFGNKKEWKDCKEGDEIRDYSFVNGLMQSTSKLSLAVENNAYTFLEFYGNEACTEPVEWPLRQPEKTAETADVYIYAKYIKGNWKMLSVPIDIKDMYQSSATNDSTTRYYLKKDIDCSSLSAMATRNKFNCELKGNGFTISNLKLAKTQLGRDSKHSFFGTLGESAKITGVTFENVTMQFQSMYSVSIFLAFNELTEGAILEDVTFKTVKISVDLASMSGAQLNNNSETNWKFGGFENDADYTGGCIIEEDCELVFEKFMN